MRSTVQVCLFGLLLCFASIAQAKSSKTFTFTNNEAVAANDLHVETKQAADPVADASGKYGVFDNVKSKSGNSHSFDGGTVNANASTKIKLESTSSKTEVKRWWWSKDGRRLGKVRRGDP